MEEDIITTFFAKEMVPLICTYQGTRVLKDIPIGKYMEELAAAAPMSEVSMQRMNASCTHMYKKNATHAYSHANYRHF